MNRGTRNPERESRMSLSASVFGTRAARLSLSATVVIDSVDNVWRSGKAVRVELNNTAHGLYILLYYKLLDSVANSSEQVLVSEIRYMRGHSSLTKEASPEFATLCKPIDIIL